MFKRVICKYIKEKWMYNNLDNISFSWVDKSEWKQLKKRKNKTISPKTRLYTKIKKQLS